MSELEIAKKISPPAWMTSEEASSIMRVLNDGSDEPQALFVGGCVRNQLLGEEVGDIDIATVHTPDVVTEKLEVADIQVIPTGIDHGTVTAVINKQGFEITTLRRDVETDGRRAVVAFTADWREDAERRDFTLNTLLANQNGEIFDPTGEGLSDLEAGKIVFVGDAAQRIAEDYLRVLRFFRFHGFYGQGDPDADALKACKDAAGKITSLSAERITQEFFKILSIDNPVDTLSLMFENNALKDELGAHYQPAFLRWFCDFQNRYGLRFLASRLFVLAGLEIDNVETMAKFLLIPKVFRKDIEAVSNILSMDDLNDNHAVKVAVYKYGRVATAQALMIEMAQDRVMNGYAPTALEIVQNWDIPDFPVSGDDLIKAGHKPGPELGAELEKREKIWVENGFKD